MTGPAITLVSPQVGDIALLTDVLNRSFSDYVVPAHFSEALVQSTIDRDSVDLSRSYLAQASPTGPIVGVALTSIRPGAGAPRSRVAAMGVAPEGRGKGVARAMLARQLADARSRGSLELLLECFSNNARALPLYESSGFQVRRYLLGFEATRSTLRLPPPYGVRLHPAGNAGPSLLPDLARRCAEARPPWQLEPESLAGIKPPREGWAIHVPGQTAAAGYIVLATSGETTEARLVQIGVLPEWRRSGLAAGALATWLSDHPRTYTVTIPPLLPDDMLATRAWLAARGFVRGPADQVEMAALLS